MGKMVVLKPVVWNDRGYTEPAGLALSSGYDEDHGYGHEEWNGRSDWVWKSWKVFHTQGKGRMFEYARDGQLGIIMTTMINGGFFAVGVGCNVYQNSEDERIEIAEALDLKANGAKLWTSLKAVRNRKRDRAEFDRHWRGAYRWVQWRCPQTHFLWFEEPVPIVPDDIIPSKPRRQAIVKMHASYQAVRPDQALAIISGGMPDGHPILDWLRTDDFDLRVVAPAVRKAAKPRVKVGRSAAPPSDSYRRYLMEHEIVVTPRHHHLQKAFEAFLAAKGAAKVKADVDCVDLRFVDPQLGPVLAEIKPTEPGICRYAIRTAIGQLLDYRQRAATSPRLLIVIDHEPNSSADKALAHDNGFGLAWRRGDSFVVAWPSTV